MKKIIAILLLSSSLLNMCSLLDILPTEVAAEIQTALSRFTPEQQQKFVALASAKMGAAINKQAMAIPAVQQGCIDAQKMAAKELGLAKDTTLEQLDQNTLLLLIKRSKETETRISAQKIAYKDPEYLKIFEGAGTLMTRFMNEAIKADKVLEQMRTNSKLPPTVDPNMAQQLWERAIGQAESEGRYENKEKLLERVKEIFTDQAQTGSMTGGKNPILNAYRQHLEQGMRAEATTMAKNPKNEKKKQTRFAKALAKRLKKNKKR